jgi:hypothetical protein
MAVNKITSGGIADGTVSVEDIADDAVTAAKLANSINTDIATGVTGNTTANAALPKAGGTMTGDLIITKTSGDVSLTLYASEDNGAREPSLNLKGYATNSNPVINFGDHAGYAGAIEYENSDNSMRLYTNASEKMRITSAGNLGIGTSSPISLTGNAEPGLTVASNGPYICLQDANNANTVRYISNNDGQLQFGLVNDDGSTSKTEHMRISSTGEVTMPAQPSVVVNGSASSYVTVANGAAAPFNNIETQTGGSNYNTSTYRYTAPIAGWYQVSFACLSNTSISMEWHLRKNAGITRRCFEETDRGWSFSTQIYCAVNDYLDIAAGGTSSDNFYSNSGSNTYSWVSYRLLG